MALRPATYQKMLHGLLRGPKPPPVSVSKAKRAAVVQRDGRQCRYCLKALAADEVTIDHVVSRAMGGRANIENLAVACSSCNSSKSARHSWPGAHICPRRQPYAEGAK